MYKVKITMKGGHRVGRGVTASSYRADEVRKCVRVIFSNDMLVVYPVMCRRKPAMDGPVG